jgi:arylformamidase
METSASSASATPVTAETMHHVPDYDLRAAVPGATAHFDRYRRASTLFRARRPPDAQNVSYGPEARQRYDLWFTDDGGPLVVFLHGGYWHSFEKEAFDYLAEGVLDAGMSYASLEYRLCPAVSITDQIADVTTGIAAVVDHAKRRGSPRRIVVTGHSAGAHLAMSATMAAPGSRKVPLVDAIVGVSGIYELAPIRSSPLQRHVRLTPTEVDACSPLRHPEHLPPRITLAVGVLETPAFHAQQSAFASAAASAGSQVTTLTVPGRDHFDVIDDLGTLGTALHSHLVELGRP